ncbi:MAG: phospholipase [Chromatiales bacterium]|nr:phospholipase [Chromatiales bacterium]
MNAANPIDHALEPVLMPTLAVIADLLHAQRHLHPSVLMRVVEAVGDHAVPVKAVQDALANIETPGDLAPYLEPVNVALGLCAKAIAALQETPDTPDGVFSAYRALRYTPYALEALYPLSESSELVSRFFLEDAEDDAALERIHAVAGSRSEHGISHVDNERGTKGGYSVYVPEFLEPGGTHPVVFALHGGSGHGRSFLWTWLKEARSRGFILVSPTSVGDTWALMEGDVDSANLDRMLEQVDGQWSVDSNHLLMTGMSDGGTFTYMSGLRGASPFSHLAPISASFHPMMMEIVEAPNIKKRPIYLTHGVHDWMFNVDVARLAHQVLSSLGAYVVYREIGDLAHTYPREENTHILNWFLDGTAPPEAA